MHIDHWSTPTRHGHRGALPFIPNEIYSHIFSYVAPSDDGPNERESKRMWSMLMKVCRQFYAQLLQHLFESVEFTVPDSDKALARKSIAFCNELNKDREPLRSLARYVRSCSIGPRRCMEHSVRLLIYSRALLRLVNLDSISLTSVVIDANIFKALESITSLKKLSIRFCTFKAKEIPDAMETLNLTHFTIFQTEHIPEILFAAVSTSSLRVLEALLDDESAVLYLIRRPIDWHLEELSVPSYMVERTELTTLLNNTPSMRTLSIGNDIRHPPYASTLLIRPSSIPNLQCLKCYPTVLPRFIPGRPIKHLQIFNERALSLHITPLNPREVAPLQKLAASLETLHIPHSHMMQLLDVTHFPQLRTLTIECDVVSGMLVPMESLTPMWSKLPRLSDLTLFQGVPDSRLHDLPYQQSVIIEDIVPKAPGIHCVTLERGISWHRSHRWYPIIPLETREDVRGALAYNHVGVVDFGGLFASLFCAEELSDGLRQRLFPN